MASSNKKKQNQQKARIYSSTFKFIDELCTFNCCKFKNKYKDLSSDELELKKENDDPCKTSLLGLSIKVDDWKFTSELFDEKDAFSFYIICMP